MRSRTSWSGGRRRSSSKPWRDMVYSLDPTQRPDGSLSAFGALDCMEKTLGALERIVKIGKVTELGEVPPDLADVGLGNHVCIDTPYEGFVGFTKEVEYLRHTVPILLSDPKRPVPVLWRRELIVAALTGAEALYGETITEADLLSGAEFWIADRGELSKIPDWETRDLAPGQSPDVLMLACIIVPGLFGTPEALETGFIVFEVLHRKAGDNRLYFQLYHHPAFWPLTPESVAYVALRRFMNSPTITTVDTEDANKELPRSERRRRRHITTPSDVRIVRLRRVEREDREGAGEEHAREYHWRWIVRSHWRKQWYPAKKEHHSIPVAAHLKGPPEAPLKQPSKLVFEVRR
jgi:hypothetical protein